MLSSGQEGKKCFSVFISVFVTSRVSQSDLALTATRIQIKEGFCEAICEAIYPPRRAVFATHDLSICYSLPACVASRRVGESVPESPSLLFWAIVIVISDVMQMLDI